jgi:2-dehydro-3-deoxyphosphogluconate aldolase/(4S)-4-hydroxy-2-oxoglutarate aldolase
VNREAVLRAVEEHRAFAVIRTDDARQAAAAGEACLRGGMRLLEVTLTVRDALEALRALAARADAVVGAGTVLDPRQVDRAVDAGARFVVSPHFDPEILAAARAAGVPCCQAGATSTEAVACQRAGADLVKVFPASAFGGPAYVRALLEPLPFLRLMPTGGVDDDNLRAYLDAGAAALGLGGALVDRESVAAGRWEAIEEKARRVGALVADWRRGRAC